MLTWAHCGCCCCQVWASLDGGFSWGLCSDDAEWGDRYMPYTVLDEEGVLYVMGGHQRDAGTGLDLLQNDVWRSTFRFSDTAAVASLCHLQQTPCGRVGLHCLPQSEGFEQGLWGVSCAECKRAALTDGGTVQTGAEAMVVAVVVLTVSLTLSFALLAWTYFRLKTAGIEVSKLASGSKGYSNGQPEPLLSKQVLRQTGTSGLA